MDEMMTQKEQAEDVFESIGSGACKDADDARKDTDDACKDIADACKGMMNEHRQESVLPLHQQGDATSQQRDAFLRQRESAVSRQGYALFQPEQSAAEMMTCTRCGEYLPRSKLERLRTGTYRRVCNHCKWLYYVKPARYRRILRELEERRNRKGAE